MDDAGAIDPDAAREHLLTDRRGVVEGTVECADRVAAAWPGAGTTDRKQVVEPLRAVLSEAGLFGEYPSVLAECVAAAGGTLDGGRLVVTLAVFDVERDIGNGRPRYVRGATTPEAAVRAEVR